MLEVFDLLQAFCGFFFCFVRAAEIFTFLRNYFVALCNFLDHSASWSEVISSHSMEAILRKQAGRSYTANGLGGAG